MVASHVTKDYFKIHPYLVDYVFLGALTMSMSMINVESNWNPKAKNPYSKDTLRKQKDIIAMNHQHVRSTSAEMSSFKNANFGIHQAIHWIQHLQWHKNQ